MSELLDRFNDVCAERGIDGSTSFAERFGVALSTLTIQAAFALAETPDWVLEVWIPNAGTTPVVWVPAPVRRFAAAFGLEQGDAESDHDFTLRVKAALERRPQIAEPP